MIPTITTFEESPDRGQGLARDMPVRWALEEVSQPCFFQCNEGKRPSCPSAFRTDSDL
jgi:hypothetical protein